jgi:hypothetical protein
MDVLLKTSSVPRNTLIAGYPIKPQDRENVKELVQESLHI